jgi:ribA/ribD-fused uncharacterized protein
MITFTKITLPYGWFGNMSRHPVTYENEMWGTSEHLFQALRFPKGSPIREEIRNAKSPMAAKMLAKKHAAKMVVAPRSNADLDLMRLCLRLKVEQHADLRTALLDTGDEVIVEDSSNRPNTSGLFWGMAKQDDGTWKGSNVLGKLWMELRDKLRTEEEHATGQDVLE